MAAQALCAGGAGLTGGAENYIGNLCKLIKCEFSEQPADGTSAEF